MVKLEKYIPWVIGGIAAIYLASTFSKKAEEAGAGVVGGAEGALGVVARPVQAVQEILGAKLPALQRAIIAQTPFGQIAPGVSDLLLRQGQTIVPDIFRTAGRVATFAGPIRQEFQFVPSPQRQILQAVSKPIAGAVSIIQATISKSTPPSAPTPGLQSALQFVPAPQKQIVQAVSDIASRAARGLF